MEMKRNLQFDLRVVDVTFQPQLVLKKGWKSVPIIEVSGRYWVGNATSAQLLEFLAGALEGQGRTA